MVIFTKHLLIFSCWYELLHLFTSSSLRLWAFYSMLSVSSMWKSNLILYFRNKAIWTSLVSLFLKRILVDPWAMRISNILCNSAEVFKETECLYSLASLGFPKTQNVSPCLSHSKPWRKNGWSSGLCTYRNSACCMVSSISCQETTFSSHPLCISASKYFKRITITVKST